jgi:hypothetical protein
MKEKEMAELAEKAVEAAKFWKMDLDYTAESLEAVDLLAQTVYQIHVNQPLPVEYRLSVANLYGAYLGEVLLRSGLEELNFAWMVDKKGIIGIGGEDIWTAPVAKVFKRITKGPEHDLMSYFELVYGLAIGAVNLDDPRLHILSEEETA